MSIINRLWDRPWVKAARYAALHKYYVFQAGRERGVSLWRLLRHDIDKFLPGMLVTYGEAFYGEDAKLKRDKTGYYHNSGLDEAFDRSWLRHQKWDHHWQSWVIILDSGGTRPMRMSEQARREMLADWDGAGRAQGITDPEHTKVRYMKNRGRMILHPETRREVERDLGITEG